MGSVPPGPRPGFQALQQTDQSVIGNGRPRERASLPRTNAAAPVPAPQIPQTGFRVPWPYMNDPRFPPRQTMPGQPQYNALTGEWFNG